MVNQLFYILLCSFLITSCVTQTEPENAEAPSELDSTMTSNNESIDQYEKEWEVLKKAIINKDEAVVLTFVSNEDPILKEAIDISYDFIFDDEIIEKIKNLELKDLDQPGVCGTDEQMKEVGFDNNYINLHKEITNDSSGILTESALEIELCKTKNGLKITNYKTFHKVYDTE